MKRLLTLCLIALGLVVLQKPVNAQTPGDSNINPPMHPPISETARTEFRIASSEVQAAFPTGPRPRRGERVIHKGVLAPSPVDVAQHQFLLSQPKTGIMRLLPREASDSAVYKVNPKVSLRGGGAYYSFYNRQHDYNYGADISLEKGELSVGFVVGDHGLLTDLGDVELGSIDATNPRAGFLLRYKQLARTEPADVRYRRSLPARVKHTYLLRSTVYNGSDLLVAFRIVSKADDGGLTIAWKILKQFSAPW